MYKIYKEVGPNISKKSYVNQPNQGHQVAEDQVAQDSEGSRHGTAGAAQLLPPKFEQPPPLPRNSGASGSSDESKRPREDRDADAPLFIYVKECIYIYYIGPEKIEYYIVYNIYYNIM